MLKIDNCKHCAAITYTNQSNLHILLLEIENSDAGYWLCMDSDNYHMEFDIFDVFDKDKKIWCRHTPQCEDLTPPA